MNPLLEVRPTEYFRENDLGDCSLLSLFLDDERACLVVTVVSASVLPSQGSSGSQWLRDFRKLHFAFVSDLRREGTQYQRHLQPFQQADINVYPQHWGMHEIHHAGAALDGDRYQIALDCGSLGTYRFHCDTFFVQERRGRGVQTHGTEWDYFDTETGVFFDFWSPFDSD
jgi:hypothetical protein